MLRDLQPLFQAGYQVFVDIAVEHLVAIAAFDVGTQILDTRGVEYVRADLMTPADVRLGVFQGLGSGIALLDFLLVKTRSQHFHRGVFVRMLRTFVLAAHHGVGRYVSDTYGRVGGVYVLTTRTGGTIGVDPQVGGVDVDFDVVVDFRRNEYSRERGVTTVARVVRAFANQTMDANNAYLDIQAGSGGTEAQDWANILLRMYLRWADKRGFDATIMELSAGEVAGIKGATVHIKGEYAFGWLRTEIGVHRLVRKSPFDSGNRRHTSFSAVFVSPEIDDNIEIDINPSDLRIDTYRSSGAGGQHVNTTDSAVRITHVPTNTVVSCQNERSQHANKDTAMKMLRARLYEQEVQKRNAASQALEDTKSDIGWGHQIRSYVLDASRIKDLRTNIERSDCDKVLDGDIDEYLVASLKQGL